VAAKKKELAALKAHQVKAEVAQMRAEIENERKRIEAMPEGAEKEAALAALAQKKAALTKKEAAMASQDAASAGARLAGSKSGRFRIPHGDPDNPNDVPLTAEEVRNAKLMREKGLLNRSDAVGLPSDFVCPRCGFHNKSLYEKQSLASTGPVANANTAPSGSFSNAAFSPSTPPWMTAPPGGLGTLGRNPMSMSSLTFDGFGPRAGHEGLSAGFILRGEKAGSRSPERSLHSTSTSQMRNLSPERNVELSPKVLVSGGGGLPQARLNQGGTNLSSSMPNLRGELRGIEGQQHGPKPLPPWQRPMEIGSLQPSNVPAPRKAGTPPSVDGRRLMPDARRLMPGAEGNDSMAAQRQAALFPTAPPWRGAGADTRSPSPSRVLQPADASAAGAGSANSRSASPARRLEPAGDPPTISDALDGRARGNWFGLQATPPWRRGVAPGTSASRAASGSDRQVGGSSALGSNALSSTAPAPLPTTVPRSVPPASGVAGAGRMVRSPSDVTPVSRRSIPNTPLDPINRQVSFAGDQLTPRQIQRLASGAGASPRSLSPARSSKSDGFGMNASNTDPASPDRVASAPTRSTSQQFSDAGTVQTSLRGARPPSPECPGAVMIGGGGRGNKYSDEWSQSLPSVTSVRPGQLLPVVGREIPAETMKHQQWEPVRRPTSMKGLKKAGIAVQAGIRLQHGADKAP